MKKYSFIATLYFIFSGILIAGQEMLTLEEIGGYVKSIHVSGEAHFVIADNRSFLKYSSEGDSQIVKGGQVVRGDKEGELELIHRHSSLSLKPLSKSGNVWSYEATMLLDRRSFGGELLTKKAVVLVDSKYGSVGYSVLPIELYKASLPAGAIAPSVVELPGSNPQKNVLRADFQAKTGEFNASGKHSKIIFLAVVICSVFVVFLVFKMRQNSK